MEKPPPRKLVTVRMPDDLGDLSGLSPAERAELVQQNERRKIYEEVMKSESDAWRRCFLSGGICVVSWMLAVGCSLLMELVDRFPVDARDAAWIGLSLVAGLSALVGLLSFYPAVLHLAQLILAMRRRRRLGRSLPATGR
ncbi:hypothetical protein HAHE_16080 [Haloferula helveola]|uniref:Holin-X, holin superfamily III n=1 Tax=Haloferula helveola TaxID=490095 RepID=A0ABM7RCC7_9BACT|nr:hypothetical protein HAHE_16080 [Haloferula helveola]